MHPPVCDLRVRAAPSRRDMPAPQTPRRAMRGGYLTRSDSAEGLNCHRFP